MFLTPGDFKKSQIDIKVHPSGHGLPKVSLVPAMRYPFTPHHSKLQGGWAVSPPHQAVQL
jgi:hypothetical protein